MGKITTELQGVTIRGGKATWTLEGDLGISRAAELADVARRVFADPKIKELTVVLPEGSGVPLATFQILRSLDASFTQAGKGLCMDGPLAPFGGRAW